MRRLLPMLLTCVPTGGCDSGGGDHAPLAPEASILLITIDTLRYEHVGVAGSERLTTPVLDLLAKNGIFFSQCYAQSSWTLPSMMSLITSLTPAELGVMHGPFRDEETGTWIVGAIPPEIETLAEALARNGFRTAGFSSNGHLTRKQGFQQGFEDFTDSSLLWKGAPEVFDGARAWLDDMDGGRFFLWVHLFDPHFDTAGHPPHYKVPEGYEEVFPSAAPASEVERVKLDYDRKIRAMDERIGEFLRDLRRRDLYEQTIVLVAVDHGEEFFEDGRWGHANSLRESLVRVPLWLRLPESRYGGTVVDHVVQNMDVAPTLLDLVGIPAPAPMDGVSLVPYFADDLGRRAPRARPVYGETMRREGDGRVELHFWIDPERDRKLVVDGLKGDRRLYDLSADPEERHDLAGVEPAVADEMERALKAYLAARQPGERVQTELSPEVVEGLRGMGYVGEDQ